MGNAFQNFFDPSNNSTPFSNMTGMIGRAFGVPTQQERLASAEADTMQKLSGMLSGTGGDPQKAILQFLQTPDGVNLMSQPGATGTLKKWVDTITPPPPTAINTPPGTTSTIYQNGRQTGSVSTPSTEVQNFNALTKGMDENTVRTIAINSLNPNEIQQRNVALDQLVREGKITQEDRDRFAAGTLSVVPETNDVGEPTGRYFQIDKLGKKAYLLSPGAPNNAPPGTSIPSTLPGTPPHIIPPHALNEDGSIDSNALTGRKYMGLGVGPVAAGLSLGGTALRWVNPANNETESQLASVRRQQIDQLEAVVAALGANGGRLKVQTNAWLDMVPSKWTDPIDAYNKLLILHRQVTNLINSETQTYKNNRLPKKVIVEAQENIQKLQNVLASMPTEEESRQMLADLRAGRGGAVTPTTGVKAGIGMATSAAKSILETGKEVLGNNKSPSAPPTPAASPNPPPNSSTPKLPSVGDISKLDENGLVDLDSKLPAGPSPERDAYNARLREIIAAKKKTPAPASRTPGRSNMRMNYDLEPVPEKHMPTLEEYLANPGGVRNLREQQRGEVIKNAKYGSDGNWHVFNNGEWQTIVPRARR